MIWTQFLSMALAAQPPSFPSRREQIALLEPLGVKKPRTMKRFEEQASKLIDSWQPDHARWLLLNGMDFYPVFTEHASAWSLIAKSVAEGDLSLIKDLIHYQPYNNSILKRYFYEHRLNHAPHLDAKLREAVNSLTSYDEIELVYNQLASLLCAYPVDDQNHPSVIFMKDESPQVFKVKLMCLIRSHSDFVQLIKLPGVSLNDNLYQILTEQLVDAGFYADEFLRERGMVRERN